MIKIEVKSAATTVRAGTSAKGRAYELTEQRGWLHGLKDYPTEVSWILEKGQVPFAPGFYVAGVECCDVDRYGECILKFSRMKPEAKVRAA